MKTIIEFISHHEKTTTFYLEKYNFCIRNSIVVIEWSAVPASCQGSMMELILPWRSSDLVRVVW